MIHQVYRLSNLGDEFQILHTPPNRHSELVSVHDAVKRDSLSLSFCRLGEQVVISREQHPPQFTGPIQYSSIIELTGPILLGGDHIRFAETKPERNGPWNMVIYVESNGHQIRPRAFNRSANDVEGIVCCNLSTT